MVVDSCVFVSRLFAGLRAFQALGRLVDELARFVAEILRALARVIDGRVDALAGLLRGTLLLAGRDGKSERA